MTVIAMTGGDWAMITPTFTGSPDWAAAIVATLTAVHRVTKPRTTRRETG